MTSLDKLLVAWSELGDDERQVVALVAQRLAAGRSVYGELNLADGRDHVHEASEELLDAVAYLAMATLRGRKS